MLYHGNQAEKVFIALFYEQTDHQENFYFTDVQDHSHLCGEFSHYRNFGVPKGGVAKISARFARLLPYLTTSPAAAYDPCPSRKRDLIAAIFIR